MKFANIIGTNLLFTTSWNSKLQCFDEDEAEESSLLRSANTESKIPGMSFRDDWVRIVTALGVDEHLGLVATGSNQGKIAVWDIETFKIEAFLIGSGKDIQCLEFITPYPLLVSSCSEGII